MFLSTQKIYFFPPSPVEGGIAYYIKKCWQLLTLTAPAQLTPNRNSYQLSKAEIEFDVLVEMYAASRMHMYAEKMTFLVKGD